MHGNNNNPHLLMEIWKQINQKLIILLEWPINNDVDIIISGVGVFSNFL